MTTDGKWERLNGLFHRLSHAKFLFYLTGLFYQAKTTFFSRNHDAFRENLAFMFLMYGFAMAFEGMRDNSRLNSQALAWYRRHAGRMAVVIVVSITAFAAAVVLGLVMLYGVKDELQGVAIVSFGLGGLALMRQEYDRINFVRSLPN